MLVYDDPRPSSSPETGPQVRSGYRLSVGRAAGAVRRRTVWIVASAVVFAGLGLVVGKALTPRYTAEAQLYIDPRDLNLVSRELTTGGQDSNAYQSVVESQTRLITSSNVLRRVVEAAGLVRDDEFMGASGGGPFARLAAALGLGPQDAPADEAGDINAAVDVLQQRLSVRRTGRTYVIDVSVWSRDAAKAARLANAVVTAYLAEDAAARTEAANRANAGLTARLGELRAALNAAENRVQAYRAESGLVGTRDALVTDQQLTQLNAQVASARARIAETQSRVEQSRRIARAGLDAGATDDVLASQTVAALRSQYAELMRRQAELTNDLGPRHPSVSSIAKQVTQARRSIEQEVQRFAQAAQTDLAKARDTAAALEKNFDQAKGRTVGLAQASIRLRELEREAEASRSVYEAFLTRSRETGQQAYLDLGNARVVTQATKPIMRSFPPPARTLMAMGLVFGLGLGIVLALLDDWMRFGRPERVRMPTPVRPPKAPGAAKASPMTAAPRSFRAPDLPDPPRSAMSFFQFQARPGEVQAGRPVTTQPVKTGPGETEAAAGTARTRVGPTADMVPNPGPTASSPTKLPSATPPSSKSPSSKSSSKGSAPASFSIAGAAALVGGAR